MLAYSVIMFLITAFILLLSTAIYKGKTNLIHSFHQTKVIDKSAYGKAFGKALIGVAMAPLCSGIVGLFGDSDMIAIIAVAVAVPLVKDSNKPILAFYARELRWLMDYYPNGSKEMNHSGIGDALAKYVDSHHLFDLNQTPLQS